MINAILAAADLQVFQVDGDGEAVHFYVVVARRGCGGVCRRTGAFTLFDVALVYAQIRGCAQTRARDPATAGVWRLLER